MTDDLARLDATAQADLVRRGEAKPVELVEAAIARIEKLEPEINALVHRRFERALQEAASLPEGPFRGVPTLPKDLWCHTAGDPFYKGMRFLRDLGWVEEQDTYLAQRLRAAGFVFVGRSSVPELGLQPTTEPEAFGPTRNPWDVTRSVGGSSGGASAAVAAGMVPIAQASDGGGSIRIPASMCGVVGLKPSRGRVSQGPTYGELTGGLSIELAVARSVRDVAAILDVLAGTMPGDPYAAPESMRPYRDEAGADPGGLRIGLLARDPRGLAEVHPECRAAAEAAARLLESLGHAVEEAHPEALASNEANAGVVALFAATVAAGLDHWSLRTGREIGPADVEASTWALAEMGRSVTGPQLYAGRESMLVNARRIAEWWATGFDLLLTPTLPDPPPLLGSFKGTQGAPLAGLARTTSIITFVAPFNTTGQPAISLPLGMSRDGLPIGVQLVAAYGREDLLIRVASQLEQARPWAGRLPPLHA